MHICNHLYWYNCNLLVALHNYTYQIFIMIPSYSIFIINNYLLLWLYSYVHGSKIICTVCRLFATEDSSMHLKIYTRTGDKGLIF